MPVDSFNRINRNPYRHQILQQLLLQRLLQAASPPAAAEAPPAAAAGAPDGLMIIFRYLQQSILRRSYRPIR